MKEELKNSLNQVFTSVSNGKTNLASALLTKGVSVDNDATFAELKDAILRIPQKLVIGVEQVPGTITYHYHYHTDASGQNPHTETSPTQGGCYTVPKYHVHSEENGCYTIRRYHQHNDSCPGHSVWVDWVPNQEPYWGWVYDCGDQPINASEKVLNCSKSTSTVDAYAVSCGWSDGQITGAEIVYDKEPSSRNVLQELPEEFVLPEGVVLPEEIQNPEEMIPIPEDMLEDMGLNPNGPEDEQENTDGSMTETESSKETETESSAETELDKETESSEETETPSEAETPSETEIPGESGTDVQAENEPDHEEESESKVPQETAEHPEEKEEPRTDSSKEE